VKVGSITHKGLRKLFLGEGSKGVPASAAQKLEDMLGFLQDMPGIEALRTVPYWKAHELTGNRKGTWSLSVTKNWRLTFKVDQAKQELRDLNLEDYH